MTGTVLAVALAVLPGAVAMQSRTATPILVAAVLAIAWAWRRRLSVLARNAVPLVPLFALALWAVGSSAWAVVPSVSLDGALRFALLVAIGAVAVGAVPSLDATGCRRAASGLVLGAAAASGMLIVEALTDGWLSNAVRLFPPAVRTVDNVKPGASVLVVLLPPAVAAAFALGGRTGALALALTGGAGVMAVPSEAARLGLVAGAAGAAAAALLPGVIRRFGPLALALAVLAGPGALQATGEVAAHAGVLPPSALHRVAIWDFVAGRAAERPLLGWGFEASRVMPGGQERVPAATLDRLAPPGPARAFLDALPDHALQRLPLHPHNGGLQIRLELGMIGLLLAAVAAWQAGRGIARARGRIALASGFGAAAAGMTVGMIAFGVWQAWWIAALLLAAAGWRAASATAASDLSASRAGAT